MTMDMAEGAEVAKVTAKEGTIGGESRPILATEAVANEAEVLEEDKDVELSQAWS